MYTAKERGGHQYCIYSDELVGEYRDRLRLHNLLTHAVVEHEFELFYQPIVDAGNGSLLGAEALIRWNSPILGRVSPLSFIPFAEQSGLIWGIGEWVLRTACKQAKEWRMKGYAPFYVSVNVSMIQFEDPRFFSLVQQVLAEFALEPKWLCLEITESVVVRNPKYVCTLVEKLCEIGIRVSMDDFGIGNSSLQYLPYMHVHTLKIDKSFLTDLETTERSVDVVASIIALAHTLRMQVVAEGVERGEQWEILNRHGCDSIQGYYVARPQPVDEFNEFLRRRQDVKKIWMDVAYHGA
jgi:EAL domain-containing protein (putative c-di-GMP-specific phosphodiesterase class I)